MAAGIPNGTASQRAPIVPTGALDSFAFEDTTPGLGREYINVNLVDDVLNAPNSKGRLRDLAYTSRFHDALLHHANILTSRLQSLPGVLCSSENKTTSPTTSKRT